MRWWLFSVLFCFSCQVMAQEDIYDPLRGVLIDDLIRNSARIYSVKIESSKHGPGSDFCNYFYTASIEDLYKGTLYAGSKTLFVSSERLAVDTEILIIKNSRSRNLNQKAQDKCLKQAQSVNPNVILIRKDEFVRLYNHDGSKFIFLPFRHFWSEREPVIKREFVEISNLNYQFLLYADGQLEGLFYRLNDFLTKKKPD